MYEIFQALLSGMLLSLSIPNPLFCGGFVIAAPISLVPLYMALRRSRNYGDAMRLAAIQAFTVHLLSSFHLMFFRDFAALTLGASALGTAGVAALFGALYFFPIHPANSLSQTACRCLPYPLHFACAYTLYEWYKSSGIGFLSYPWGTLPCATSNLHLLSQTADLCGVWGISFMLSLFSASLGEAILLLGSTAPYEPPSQARTRVCGTAGRGYVVRSK